MFTFPQVGRTKAPTSRIFCVYFVSSADWLLIYSGVLWEMTEAFFFFFLMAHRKKIMFEFAK